MVNKRELKTDEIKSLRAPEPKTVEPEQIVETQSEEYPGREGKIGAEWCKKSNEVLKRYISGKAINDDRMIKNNEWYRQRHWEHIEKIDHKLSNKPQPTTAWLFNSIANQHANVMDNYPEAVFLPRSADDEKTAKLLSPVFSAIKEENRYQRTYSKKWWDKLIGGTGVTGVFWNFQKNGGSGGVEIKRINPLNLYWKPRIDDIQASPRVYHLEEVDRESLVAEYSFLEDKALGLTVDTKRFNSDENNFDAANNAVVVHCWYKQAGKLHYCKYINEEVLFASENVDRFKDGYYLHGEYPYHPDPLYPVEDSVLGMGYVDLFKSCQMYIDKLEQAMLVNAIANANPRVMATTESGINKTQLANPDEAVVDVKSLSERTVQPFTMSQLTGAAFNMLEQKINEMKETSANRDFSQGSASSGVTSGAAIAALQESGNKNSRDIIKASYEIENRQDMQILNLLRQFMTEPDFFRIVGEDKRTEYFSFDNKMLLPQPIGDIPQAEGESPLMRLPVFDIQIKAQKQSPFSTMEVNDRQMTMFKLGMFNPEAAPAAIPCVEGMSFEGKDELIATLKKNGTLMDLVRQMQAKIQNLRAIIAGAATSAQTPTGSPNTALTQGADI